MAWWQTAYIVALFVLGAPFILYCLLLAVIFIHEIGHLLAGLLVGIKFGSIRVGPLQINHHRRLAWKWAPATIATGWVDMLPEQGRRLRVRVFTEIAAGPIANILSAFLVLRIAPRGDSAAFVLSRIFVGGSFIVGLANLIPFRIEGVASDGMRLWMLCFSKRKRERWLALLNRRTAILRGELPETMQSAATLASIDDQTADYVNANWVAHTSALEIEDNDAAARYLEACLAASSLTSVEFREELMLAAARFQATRRSRIDVAQQWLLSGDPKIAKINRACTEAIVLYYDGQVDQALAKIDAGSLLVQQTPAGPLRDRQTEAWKQLQKIFEQSRKDLPIVSPEPPGNRENDGEERPI
jgi:hypothetical protein